MIRVTRLTGLMAGVLAFAVLLVTAAPPAGAAAAEILPDLRMQSLRNFYIQNSTSGERRLRFTTIIVNSGPGRFEARGYRPDTTTARMKVTQRIYNSDGTISRNIAIDPAKTYMEWADDGHNHWHVKRLQKFTLRPIVNGQLGEVVGRGAKTGFCFWDNTKYNLSLANAPDSAYYTGCGTRDATRVRMGLSTGWGDTYGAGTAYQWIRINGLKDGDYRVRVTADYYGWFTESNDGNNHTWTDIRISNGTVTILRQGPAA